MGRSRKKKAPSQRHTLFKNTRCLPMKKVSKIQSRAAKRQGGMIKKGSLAAKLQSQLARYALANQSSVCRFRNGCRCRRSPMRPDAAARIMRSTARRNGGMVPKRSFAARAQRAAARNCFGTK